MAIKAKGGYKCGYCYKLYKTSGEADKCKDDHGLIYVALGRDDLNRLMNFIYIKEEKLLSESLMKNLGKYAKGMRFMDVTKIKDLDR